MRNIYSLSKNIKFMQHVLVFTLYVLLTLLFTYPSLNYLNSDVLGDGGDGIEYLSYAHIFRLHNQFGWTDIYNYPAGFNFDLGSDARLFVILGGTLLSIFGDIHTYNLLVVSLLALNGYVSWLFFKELSQSSVIGFIGGLVYGLSYYVLARSIGHINLMQVYSLPLVALVLLKILRSKNMTWSQVGQLTLALSLMALSTLQYILLTFVFLLLVFPIWTLTYKNELKTLEINVFKAIFFKLLVVLIFVVSFFSFFFPSQFENDSGKYLDSADWVNRKIWNPIPTFKASLFPNPYFVPIIFKGIESKLPGIKTLENSLYIGHIELFIWIIGLFILPMRKNIIFLYSLSIFFYLLSFKLLHSYVSGFVNFQAVWPFSLIFDWQRLFVIYYLVFTSLLVLVLKKLKIQGKKAVITILIIVICLERATLNYYHKPLANFRGKNFETEVRKLPGTAVFDIPINTGTEYSLFPFSYNKKSVQGFFHWPARSPESDYLITGKLLSRFNCELIGDLGDTNTNLELNRILIKKMRALDIRVIVVHKKYFYEQNCLNVRKHAFLLLGDLTFEESGLEPDYYNGNGNILRNSGIYRVYSDGDALVYRVN